MIAVIDYGAGNLGSVDKALRYLGVPAVVTSDPETVLRQRGVILPGVGALAHCMDGMRQAGLIETTLDVIASGRPFLGICIGMQMLFDESEEGGRTPGLGVIKGKVRRFSFGPNDDRKVPHMGWNSLDADASCPLFAGVPRRAMAYFVHSYFCVPNDNTVTVARTDYGVSFCSALMRGNVFATQFHPEKSGTVGLQVLRNFAALVS